MSRPAPKPDKATKADKAMKPAKATSTAKPGQAAVTAPPRAKSVGWFERLTWFGFLRKSAGTPPTLSDAVAKPATRRRDAAAGRSDATRMLAALQGVLDRHAASRSVLVHLGLVEQALEQHGLRGLDDVPAAVLSRALTQLETLVSDWSEVGIAALRAQIKGAMVKPGRLDAPKRARAAAKSTEFDNSRLQVNDASVSTFLEARAMWERSATGGR